MKFWLGTDMPGWLRSAPVPLFVSRIRLDRYKTLPVAAVDWALDSGGFTELDRHDGWRIDAQTYAATVRRYVSEIGRLQWCAPQDWMCEPSMLANTRLTVAEHQRRTVINFLELRQLLGTLVIPVVQGWDRDDYLAHCDAYAAAGVDLADEALVGVGSVCRRQGDREVLDIFDALQPLRLHGFGVKGRGLALYAPLLTSADSMAWSYNARRNPPLPGHTHARCNHCIEWALRWRDRMLDRKTPGVQMSLPFVA